MCLVSARPQHTRTLFCRSPRQSGPPCRSSHDCGCRRRRHRAQCTLQQGRPCGAHRGARTAAALLRALICVCIRVVCVCMCICVCARVCAYACCIMQLGTAQHVPAMQLPKSACMPEPVAALCALQSAQGRVVMCVLLRAGCWAVG